MITIIAGVKYVDLDPSTYRGIEIGISITGTSNPADDWRVAQLLIEKMKEEIPGLAVLNTSSVDNFVLDGGNLDV